ncbi:uncharacterized protein RAG0_08482 [Rhynchosporium agropyri]|uniref:Uncharacterized protein n=1 Tax=Rhynchosporium agropyri TaxID=914238 RepID=A0A1E1KR09_9HELO|nr:uncharacterized protein RAG0_08482 [Rhynchosporium agropyri]
MKLFRAFKVEVRSGFSSVKEYLTAGEEDVLNLRNDIIALRQQIGENEQAMRKFDHKLPVPSHEVVAHTTEQVIKKLMASMK